MKWPDRETDYGGPTKEALKAERKSREEAFGIVRILHNIILTESHTQTFSTIFLPRNNYKLNSALIVRPKTKINHKTN